MKIEGWRARWLMAVGYRLLKIWAWTLRFEVEDRGDYRNAPRTQRTIGALWHNRLFLIPFVVWRFLPTRRGSAALISASRDGAIFADLVARFGFQPVRGSSSRKGTSALLQLADILASGNDALIIPDGPRGPVYEISPGIIFLAQKTGAAILPINMEYSSCWRIKSWDRLIIPRPFSRVRVIFDSLHHVPPTASDEEFEAERLRLHDTMMSLVERR